MAALKLSAILSIIAITISGCAALEGLGSNVTPPTLIEKTPFPKLPRTVTSNDFYLKMHLLVSDNGTVRQASLDNSSGDPSWDSVAIACVLKWKYSPAMADSKPIQMKIEQAAHVVYVPPVMMDISEMMFTNSNDAGKVYAELKEGKSFDSLAASYSVLNPKQGSCHLGNIDINRYPEDVVDALSALKPGEFTAPLKLGTYTAIFMRAAEKAAPEALK